MKTEKKVFKVKIEDYYDEIERLKAEGWHQGLHTRGTETHEGHYLLHLEKHDEVDESLLEHHIIRILEETNSLLADKIKKMVKGK